MNKVKLCIILVSVFQHAHAQWDFSAVSIFLQGLKCSESDAKNIEQEISTCFQSYFHQSSNTAFSQAQCSSYKGSFSDCLPKFRNVSCLQNKNAQENFITLQKVGILANINLTESGRDLVANCDFLKDEFRQFEEHFKVANKKWKEIRPTNCKIDNINEVYKELHNCIMTKSKEFHEKAVKAKQLGDADKVAKSICYYVNNLVDDCLEIVEDCHDGLNQPKGLAVKDLIKKVTNSKISDIAQLYQVDGDIVCGRDGVEGMQGIEAMQEMQVGKGNGMRLEGGYFQVMVMLLCLIYPPHFV